MEHLPPLQERNRKMDRINLNGPDWLMKEFVGMDWVWRDRNASDR